MPLSINTNVSSLNAQRAVSSAGTAQARSIARLSSGSRINRASDDAAGQAIASRMSAGLRGMSQATRNLNDASSLLQVADSAMASVSDSLQRLRELAVQAGNSTVSASDRATLQHEAGQILAQITQVGEQTMFNGQAVFAQDRTSIGGDADRRAVIDGLKSGWLTSAENMVRKYYGLEADGTTLTVNLDSSDGGSNVLASVSGTIFGGSGKYHNVHLNIDMADFGAANLPDGGGAPMYSDRIVAHEMVHAIMSRSTNFTSLPQWFTEGTAELIHGADERLRGAIGGGGVAAVVNDVGSGGFSYASAYAASRYLHAKLNDMGVEGGIKGIMVYLNQHQTDNLDQALNAVTGGAWASSAAFVADYAANGAAYINTRMNLTNADTGAIGGLDADGGPERNARDVVSDVGDRGAPNVLAGFAEVFPTVGGFTGTRQVQVQVGTHPSDMITLNLSAMNAGALGLADLDLHQSAVALMHIDQALEFVTQQRVVAGTSTKRLELAADSLAVGSENMTASRSRILDTDYAAETVNLTRSQILQQAAAAVLTQANSMPRAVLALLR
jgi:flagellin